MNQNSPNTATWEQKRAFVFFTENKQSNEDATKNIMQFRFGQLVKKTKSVEDARKFTLLAPNDIIVNGLNLNYDFITQRVAIAKEVGAITSAYMVLRPRDFVNPFFAYYLLKAMDSKKILNGMGTGVRLTLSYNEFRSIRLSIPPRCEQDKIVEWLDWQTSRISSYTCSKKREINCLSELKKAIISEAVTQGLDRKAKMKDSGVKWLGNVPEHWDIETIKRHFTIKKDIAGKEGYDVLSITQRGIKVKNIESNEGQLAQNYSSYQFVHPGDFAMNHMDLITGFIDYSSMFGVTSPDYRVFMLNDEKRNSPHYFLYVFQNCYYRHIFYAFGRGAAEKGRWRLPKENFNSFQIPLPPRDEQDRIVAYLDEQCTAIDAVIAKLMREIELVNEYKTSIISDAVTGKIDLRNVEIPDFEPLDELINDTEEGTENEDD